ncbi:helix-turn-helix domain-containing protein, partial [Mediterraneibacter glycyrrhizinilyticus]|nr:helix-turn-helix domain-containing protein [Mediterraneibacter glycyrrhizinilyticus]
RLTMAERRLKSSDSPVLEIAALSGFDNLSYFNRIFKRKYGISDGGCALWRCGRMPSGDGAEECHVVYILSDNQRIHGKADV